MFGFAVGDRIAYVTGHYGAYVSERILPATLAVRLPPGISEQVGARVLLKGLTAEMLVRAVIGSNLATSFWFTPLREGRAAAMPVGTPSRRHRHRHRRQQGESRDGISCRLYLNRVQFENRSPASRTKGAELRPNSLTTSEWDYWSQTGRALAADEAAALLNAARAVTEPPTSRALRLLSQAAVVTAGYAIAEGMFTACLILPPPYTCDINPYVT